MVVRGPAVCMGVRLFPAVHGHIADSVRDHRPVLVAHSGGIARDGEAEAGGSPTACSWISMLAVLSEEPSRLPEDHWWIERLATRSPRDPRALTRTLISGIAFD